MRAAVTCADAVFSMRKLPRGSRGYPRAGERVLRLRVSIATNVHPANELVQALPSPQTGAYVGSLTLRSPGHQHSPGFFRATTPILTAKESFRHPSPELVRCWRLPKHL